jgi:antitoxin ParD1/3/4
MFPLQTEDQRMATRNIVMTDDEEKIVDSLVVKGRYPNASEVLRAGLRLVEREEAEEAELRDRLTRGLEEYRRGERAEGTGEEAIRRAFAAGRARK